MIFIIILKISDSDWLPLKSTTNIFVKKNIQKTNKVKQDLSNTHPHINEFPKYKSISTLCLHINQLNTGTTNLINLSKYNSKYIAFSCKLFCILMDFVPLVSGIISSSILFLFHCSSYTPHVIFNL